MRNAFGWLYAIAGFTLVNTIAMVGGMQFRMLVGLGASLLATAVFWRSGAVGVAISVMATLVAAGGFAYLGYRAQKKASRVALLVGAIVYALDTALLIWLRDWPGTIFHAIGLVMIFGGYRAASAAQGEQVFTDDGQLILASGRSSAVMNRIVGGLALGLAAIGAVASLVYSGLFAISMLSASSQVDPIDVLATTFMIVLPLAICGIFAWIGLRMLRAAKASEASETSTP